jgi:pyruvate/2-oxoglutarate dehydrogenase complex dihydrolipoamide acyltransferase (E2) component
LPAGQPAFSGKAAGGGAMTSTGNGVRHAQPAAVRNGMSLRPAAVDAVTTQGALPEPLWNWEGETLFSREAARMVADAGIDPAVFAGRDFVTAGDVSAYLRPAAPATPAVAAPAGGTKEGGQPKTVRAVLPADPNKVILEKLTSGKKREIEYLGEVQSTGLTSTIHVYVETEGIFTHINRSLQYLKDSLLPVILYEASRLLTDYPLLNAYFTGEAIARYKEVNPGFAIDIDKGLKVLKIAGAGQQSIGEIEQAIMRLSGNYLDETLSIDELTDITFTITDLSSEGVAFFRPLINKMNSSILGVSSIDGKLQRCALSLTFDHRVTEGKTAALFLKELKERLESYRPKDHSYKLAEIVCFKCYKTLKEDLGGTGFARVITPEGKEGTICQSCLKGF